LHKLEDYSQNRVGIEVIADEFINSPEDSSIPVAVRATISAARDAIARVYKREWGRAPHVDELTALFQFCACGVA
jgi:hypothetical protein